MESQFCECGHPKSVHVDSWGCLMFNHGLFCKCTSFDGEEQPRESIDELSLLRAENEHLRAELAALKRPPVILDQDERKDLEQRLYEAQMLEGSEMEY